MKDQIKNFTLALAACIWAMLPALAFSNPMLTVIARKKAALADGGGFTGDLINEGAEGSGTPAGWTDISTPDWDYATSPAPLDGEGAQSLRCTGSDSSYFTFAGQSTVEAYFLVNITTLPAAEATFCGFRNGTGGAVCLARVNASGNLAIYANGSDSTYTVDAVSAGSTYHIFLRFVSGGTSTIAFSSDGTRPSSGDAFTSKTAASGTTERFAPSHVGGNPTIFDKMIIDTGTIPPSP